MNHRSILLGLIAVLLASLALSGSAAAHAQYVNSDPKANAILPTAPTRVAVTVSEAIQPGTGGIAVTNASGERFDQSPVNYSSDRKTMSVSLRMSGPGIYTVLWRAVSATDGHPTTGSFAYAVQDANGNLPAGFDPNGQVLSSGNPVSPLEVGLRFFGFLGLAVAFGIGVMATFMWLAAGRDADIRALRAHGMGFSLLLNVGRVAAFAFAASMAGLFALSTALEGDVAAAGLAGSPYLQSVAARLALGALLFVLFSRTFGRSRVDPPEATARSLQASIALALAAIAAGSLGTHAAGAPVPVGLGPLGSAIPAIAVLSDAAHLAGIGLWLGGLAGLVSVRALLREPEAAPLARIVLGRFSRLAAYAVGLVLAGGLILSIVLVGSVEGLLGSAYGWVVLAKVALFAPMLGIGAFNRYVLIPRTAEAQTATDAVRHLVSNVRFETLLGIAVLILAGLLTSMTPAATVSASFGPFSLEAPADDLRVRMQVFPDPSGPGVYYFEFLAYDATTGAPYDAAAHNTTARMTLTLVNSTLPPKTMKLDGPHYPNHFLVYNVTLSQAGVWRIVVTFTRTNPPVFDVLATFHLPIRAGA